MSDRRTSDRLTAKSSKQKTKVASKPVPKEAPVPPPNITILPTQRLTVNQKRSLDAHEARWRSSCQHRAKKWLETTPSFILSNVSFQELASRSKNTNEGKEEAAAKMRVMESWPSDACSGRWYDKDHILVLAAFAHHIRDENDTSRDKKVYSVQGRTEKDVAAASIKDPASVLSFGLSKPLQNQIQEVTQLLHSVLKPVAQTRDVRHDDEKVMKYQAEAPSQYHEGDRSSHTADKFAQIRAAIQRADEEAGTYPDRPGVETSQEDELEEGYERSGVTHLLHAWHARGHKEPTDILYPSTDMCKGSGSALAVKYYFQATRDVAIFLDEYFRIAFPEQHSRYKEAFEAGIWLQEDPGPWLGRAVVYKLQVKPHQDGLDDGPSAIFNVGQYTGGYLYITCLDLKFLYKPGDIFIFFAGSLYHAVGHWSPSGGPSPEGVTPGRIGHVFFSPKSAMDNLDGRPPGWRNDTFSGAWPSTSTSKVVQKSRKHERAKEDEMEERSEKQVRRG